MRSRDRSRSALSTMLLLVGALSVSSQVDAQEPSAGGGYPLQCSASGAVIQSAAPAVPPPTAEQLAAFSLLQAEAKGYATGSKDFQSTLTKIVRHHYEERRRRVLSAIDREIDLEKQGLDDARDEAIRRLEEFIAKYSGPNSDPQATPDAMFRLAALYEERARSDYDADLTEGLDPAIALYRKIIVQYPSYEEIAAVHYYLGHALNDAARIDEAQQAWRSLVCANRYQVTTSPDDPEKIELQELPQDHDREFWTEWYNKNPIPLDELNRRPDPNDVTAKNEELVFKDPYADCEQLPQDVEPGEEPRYVAEVWWQLGNFHFDQMDAAGGPYNLNRAASAYEHSLKYKKPPLYGVSMYKLAWTYFKQQRYRTAVEWFVNLLHYADEQEAKTGDPGADFRAEAFTYIAGSLTYVDIDGPPPQDPYIPRSDVLDLETDPLAAEEKMAIAIERVQDPSYIPQDKKWTGEIYKSLAREFIEITQNRNAIRTLELTVNKFPLDRDAPSMVNKVAELYDELSRLAPEGSPTRTEYAEKALAARTRLVNYVGATPWTEANKDDPEALAQAEELVRFGLRRAAADHTNYARAYKDRALQLSDPAEQTRLLEKAIEEYKLAAQGWAAFLDQDPNATDAYESRFWLADARFWAAVLQVPLGRTPTDQEYTDAREASVAVRDSNEDDKFKQPAGYYVVTLAEKMLEAQYRDFEQSDGAKGIEKKTEVKVEGEGRDAKVIAQSLPPLVEQAVCARDEYNARIPLEADPQKNGLLYAYQSADYFFVYGQFEEAHRRFEPLYQRYCGKNEYGYKAWDKLISMAALTNNTTESRRLVEGKSCAVDEETRLAEEAIREPVKMGVAYMDAAALYEEAQKMPEGPARDQKWRQAAAAYKVALDAAPDRDEAPEAAMNGAYAYKQVGEYDKAIAMYRLFIDKYGDESTLQKLKSEGETEKYEERVKFLSSAYTALAEAYVLFFDYPKAAETFDKISSIDHFSNEDRKTAAKQALILYASLDDTAGMNRSRDRYRSLGANAEELAEADFLIASAPLKKWDEKSPNEGANNQARLAAQRSMDAYYQRNRNNAAANKYVVQAAYQVAKTNAAVKSGETNRWWQRTIDAFIKYKASAPKVDGQNEALGSLEAGMAAEADYTMIDEKLRKDFDYETGHHRYKGTVVEVTNQFKADVQEAEKWRKDLQRVVDDYLSTEWAAVATARQGSLYDSLRTGLFNTRPPALQMFTKQQEAALRQAEESDNLDLQDKADEIRTAVNTAWRQKRDQELDAADRNAVGLYATSVVLAQRYNLSNPILTRSIRRLAFLTDVVGEAKMAEYTSKVQDLNYTPGMFQRMRPGVVTAPESEGMPEPLPVMVQ